MISEAWRGKHFQGEIQFLGLMNFQVRPAALTERLPEERFATRTNFRSNKDRLRARSGSRSVPNQLATSLPIRNLLIVEERTE